MPSSPSVLVTGGAGLVGQTLIASAPSDVRVHATRRRRPVTGAASQQIDLADAAAVDALMGALRPELVIHTAYGRADGERDIVLATRAVAAAARRHGAGLIHLSTDVVFDGEHAPYAEADRIGPVDQYGRWKAQAERDVTSLVPDAAVVRTSLIARADPLDPASRWVAEALDGGRPVRLFVDVLRCAIRVDDLAAMLWELTRLPRSERAGPWHLVGPETVTRYTLGLLIAAHLGLHPGCIVPVRSAEDPEPRPRDLRLSTARADRMLATRPRPVSSLFTPAGSPGPVLRGPRLVLQPLTARDLAALQAHWNDPAVRRFLWDDRTVDASTVAGLVRRSSADFGRAGYGLWGVRFADAEGLVGVAGLRAVDRSELVELLFSIDPGHQGRGLATEAARTVLAHAFDRLGLDRVVGAVDPPNTASARVLSKLGLRVLRELRVGGQPLVYYAVTRLGTTAQGNAAGTAATTPHDAHGLWFSLGEEDRMSQRDPDNDAAAEETPGDIPAGSGKQFAADVSPAAARAEGGEERTPEGSGKQFAGERRGDQPDDEEGKAFARDVSEETDEARAPDAPADSGKGFARGAPEPGPPGTP